MRTNWVAPGTGATLGELLETFSVWPSGVDPSEPDDTRTNLMITTSGAVEAYDYDRLRSGNVEVGHA
jgi:hypothetical protein